MGQVVSFTRYVPAARFDHVAWATAQIEEAPTSTGDWTVIDLVTLTPIDPDPSHPATRSFSTENASDTPMLWYRVVFLDASGDTSQPTQPVQNGPAQPDPADYITLEEFKAVLGVDSDFQDEQLLRAITAGSRDIDDICNQFFYRTGTTEDGEERYYTPRYIDELDVDPLLSVLAFETDQDGDGIYETTWTAATDYLLEPANASSARPTRPYERVLVAPRGRHCLPFRQPASVKITGSFGWLAVPDQIIEATGILSAQILRRTKDAPFGILGIAGEGQALRIGGGADQQLDKLLSRFIRDAVLA